MSLGLLAPLGLAALAALALPLLVHLARREEQVPTDFAALRWLAAKFRPRQRLRFEEILLLALRLLLVAALALLLAQPVLFGGRGDAAWLVVLPGADMGDAPRLPEGTQRRWLAPGFPPIESPMPAAPVATGSLLRQLDAELPAATPVTVLVTADFDGADGARPKLSRTMDWRVVAGAPAAAPAAPRGEFALAIRHAPDREAALPYLRAAVAAWQAGHETLPADAEPGDSGNATEVADLLDIAGLDAALPEKTRPLAWLAPGELPAPVLAWIHAGGTALIEPQTDGPAQDGTVVWRDAAGQPLARAAALGAGRVVQLAQPLSPAALPALLQPDFPQRLRELLEPAAPAPTRASAAAYAPMAGGPSFPETPRELSTWLVWLVLVLFALERWVASRRREVAA
ncbi:MAG: BatA domain-containing protein [Arenimonas sp.]|nr:BatA domain-containing protein [Arenimonas sp.]